MKTRKTYNYRVVMIKPGDVVMDMRGRCSAGQKVNLRHQENTSLQDFQPGPTQTGLYSHRIWFEAWNFGFRKWMDCTIFVAKTKVLISSAVTTQLICTFVNAYTKSWFSHYWLPGGQKVIKLFSCLSTDSSVGRAMESLIAR